MITDGESALMIACSPPFILIGLFLVPFVKLSTRSLYVPLARYIVSPALAARRASESLYTLDFVLYPDDAVNSPVGVTLRVVAPARRNRVLSKSAAGSSRHNVLNMTAAQSRVQAGCCR